MLDNKTIAEAYHLAAKWHDKQYRLCKSIIDDCRVGSDINEKASIAAKHHAASSAGLKNAAYDLMRKEYAT